MIVEALKAAALGAAVGGLFALVRLPIPAPTVPGAFGVFGISAAYVAVRHLTGA